MLVEPAPGRAFPYGDVFLALVGTHVAPVVRSASATRPAASAGRKANVGAYQRCGFDAAGRAFTCRRLVRPAARGLGALPR
jgi:hypothetical protein